MRLKLRKNSRKGQVWTMDFVIGMMLFIIVLLITVKVTVSMKPSQDHIVAYRDAVHLSDSLLSKGYPDNWNNTHVVLPGIGENNRINSTKLYYLSELEYAKLKTLMHTTNDFIFFIRNNTNVIDTGDCVYGYNITVNTTTCEPQLNTITYENLVRIDRLVIYNSTTQIMTVYVWN